MNVHGFILRFCGLLILFSIPALLFSQVNTVTVHASQVVSQPVSNSYPFQNLSRAIGAPNGSFMTATCSSTFGTEYSNRVILKGFNLNLPANAVVTNITMSIAKRTTESHILFGLYDHIVQLNNNGTAVGPNKASALKWQLTLNSTTYTWTSSDLASLNPAVVNSANFGILLQIRSAGISGSHTSSVDGITFTVSYITSVLPAILKSFEVSKESGKSLIEWKVDPDAPGEEILIEYSANQQSWTSIYREMITDNNYSGKFSHSASDSKTAYYRLKLVRDDEVLWVSPVKNIKSTQAKAQAPFPNPVKDLLYVSSQEGKLSVFNINGQSVFPAMVRKGDLMVLDFSALKPGLYFVKTEEEVYRIVRK